MGPASQGRLSLKKRLVSDRLKVGLSRAAGFSNLGAVVLNVPAREELPALVSRVARLWAELHEADRELALELARKLPEMEIRRAAD